MNTAWIYTVDPEAEEPIMLINDHIGFDQEDGMGIDGGQFQNELLCLDGMAKKRIQVFINSPGGSVLDGYNIYSAILKSKTKVDTYCTGMAASIAAVIFQAGRTRYMSDYGFLMYHNPSGSDDGKIIGMMKESIAKMTARSGKPEDEIIKMMNKETYINAADAKDYGLCDEVEPSNDLNKKRLAAIPVTSMYKEAQAVLNSVFKKPEPKTKKAMLKVTNMLRLNAEASEDAIASEIERIQNKAKEEKDSYEAKMKSLADEKKGIEDAMNALKKEKADADDAKNKAEAAQAKAEGEVADLKKKADEAEDKAMEEECKNVLNKYQKAGKIKNDADTTEFWTAIYKAGKDVCIKQLDALPLNKQGAKIEVAATIENEAALTSVATRAMADIRNRLKI